jgi:excisionase family DNA binding protein
MSNFSKKLKSVDQIAKKRRWSPKRVRALISEGLPVVKIGRQCLIYEDTLDQYLHEREAPRQANLAAA